MAYEGIFLAGLTKLAPSSQLGASEPLQAVAQLPPHRPFKVVYASLYYDVRPSFVVDITNEFNQRFEALMAYRSQYEDQQAGSSLFPQRQEIRQRLETMASFYGLLAGVRYAEPFVQKEVGMVDDLLAIPVKSI